MKTLFFIIIYVVDFTHEGYPNSKCMRGCTSSGRLQSAGVGGQMVGLTLLPTGTLQSHNPCNEAGHFEHATTFVSPRGYCPATPLHPYTLDTLTVCQGSPTTSLLQDMYVVEYTMIVITHLFTVQTTHQLFVQVPSAVLKDTTRYSCHCLGLTPQSHVSSDINHLEYFRYSLHHCPSCIKLLVWL